nr:myomegalin-like isoform X1 [Macaca fascicularis]
MHNMSKVTEVLETKRDAQSQTQPQIWCNNHTRSAPHHSLSSTSPQLDKQEVRPSVTVVNASAATSADSAALPSNQGARSAQPFHPSSGTGQLSRTLEHGSSGPWEEMRPQKMNASGDLASFSCLYQPNSETSVPADLLEKNLAEIQKLRQRLEESVSLNDRLRERLEHVLSNGDQGKGRKAESLCFCPHLGSLKRAYRFLGQSVTGVKHIGVHDFICSLQSAQIGKQEGYYCSQRVVCPKQG